MPINKNYFCVLDFETDDLPIHKLNPIQLSSLMIEPRGLEIVNESEFNTWILPEELMKGTDDEYYQKHKGTIDWHCRNRKWTVETFLKKLRDSPPEKVAWTNYLEYLKKYNTGGGVWGSPIPTGENISNFDLKIIDKLCNKYKNLDKNGNQNIFCTRDTIELKQIYFMFFHNLSDGPSSYSADNIYPWLGITIEGRHDSLEDVRGAARIFIRFMRYCRNHGKKSRFKGSFANDTN